MGSLVNVSSKLLFIPDRNGDLVPDGEPQVMLDGFDVARGNYHILQIARWDGMDGYMEDVVTPAGQVEYQAHLMNSLSN